MQLLNAQVGEFALIEYIATVPHYSKYPREGYKDIFLPAINILKEKSKVVKNGALFKK